MPLTSLTVVPGSRSVVALGLLGVGAGVLVACDDSDAPPSAAAQVIEAVVLDVAAELPPDPEQPEALPVVYVVSGSDEPFSARVQANVASAVTDTVDVRFADAREEPLADDRPGRPVLDHGALVEIGKLVPDETPMTVEVEVYWSETQFSRRVITFGRRGDEWSESASSVLEEMDVPPTVEPTDGDDDASPTSPLSPTPSS